MNDYSNNINANIENAVLNTFPFAEEMGKTAELFKLDTRNFTNDFRKRLSEQINDCLENDKSINLMFMKACDKCKGTNYEYEFLNVVAQSPLTPKMAKEYHAHLAMLRIERGMNVKR